MLNTVSERKKGIFLLGFTEELIRNTREAEMCKLEEILRQEKLIGQDRTISKKSIREEVQLKLKKPIFKKTTELTKELFKKSILPPRKEIFQRNDLRDFPKVPIKKKRRLKIPPVNLPPRLRNIQPIPTSQTIEIEKLNPLINDPSVKTIECRGENEKIIVTGKMGEKPTNIILSKEEINEIIDNFSKLAKIPKSEGLFKVAYGKLVLTAMVSSTISSTFIIKKIENHIPRPPQIIK